MNYYLSIKDKNASNKVKEDGILGLSVIFTSVGISCVLGVFMLMVVTLLYIFTAGHGKTPSPFSTYFFRIFGPVLVIGLLFFIIFKIAMSKSRNDLDIDFSIALNTANKIAEGKYTINGLEAKDITFDVKRRLIVEKINQLGLSYDDIAKSQMYQPLLKYISKSENKENN